MPMDQNRKTTRGGITRESVALAVLQRIIAGDYAPGARLPAQAKLRPEFGPNVSMSTLNGGLRILKELGFLDIRRQSSTRVASPLPYRNRIAITFPYLPDPNHPTTLYSVIHDLALKRRDANTNEDFTLFYGTTDKASREHTLHKLEEEVRWHRIAGVLFASEIRNISTSSIYREPGIARVSLAGWEPKHMPPMPRTTFDAPTDLSFRNRALEQLRAQGVRQVAVFFYTRTALEKPVTNHMWLKTDWTEALAEYGMQTRPQWLLPIDNEIPEVAHLLMTGREQPEAIIITDDILVPSVTRGIRDSGSPPPHVIALANYPAIPTSHVPCEFLGHDIEAAFDACVGALHNPDAQHAETLIPVPAIFETEWRQQRQA